MADEPWDAADDSDEHLGGLRMTPAERSSLLEVEAGDAVDIIQDLVAEGLGIVEDDNDRDNAGVVDEHHDCVPDLLARRFGCADLVVVLSGRSVPLTIG